MSTRPLELDADGYKALFSRLESFGEIAKVGVEFDSFEAAPQWYDPDSYQAVLPLRLAASDCNVVICSGFMPKDPRTNSRRARRTSNMRNLQLEIGVENS